MIVNFILRQLTSIKTTINDNYFFRNKNTASRKPTKIFKIKDYPLFLPKRMQRTALVGKTIWLEAEHLQRSLVDARKRAIRLKVIG